MIVSNIYLLHYESHRRPPITISNSKRPLSAEILIEELRETHAFFSNNFVLIDHATTKKDRPALWEIIEQFGNDGVRSDALRMISLVAESKMRRQPAMVTYKTLIYHPLLSNCGSMSRTQKSGSSWLLLRATLRHHSKPITSSISSTNHLLHRATVSQQMTRPDTKSAPRILPMLSAQTIKFDHSSIAQLSLKQGAISSMRLAINTSSYSVHRQSYPSHVICETYWEAVRLVIQFPIALPSLGNSPCHFITFARWTTITSRSGRRTFPPSKNQSVEDFHTTSIIRSSFISEAFATFPMYLLELVMQDPSVKFTDIHRGKVATFSFHRISDMTFIASGLSFLRSVFVQTSWISKTVPQKFYFPRDSHRRRSRRISLNAPKRKRLDL